MKTLRVEGEEKKDRWMDVILDTLKKLTPAEREAFVLYRYRSLSLPEISAKLSLSIQEVEKLLSSAQSKLIDNLKTLRTASAV